MAEYVIQQKASVYYEVVVDATNLEEALAKAEDSNNWERTESVEFEDEYWYSTDGGLDFEKVGN